MEDIRTFYVHVEYFTDIWYILWPFGIFSAYFVYFSQFWCVEGKNLATLLLRPVLKKLSCGVAPS
jgi:hypothetical protein